MGRRPWAWTAVAVALALGGCGGDDDIRTVTVKDKAVERFSYSEVERQARKTCAAIERDSLTDGLRAASSDRGAYSGRRLTDNDIAQLYAEDVRISPVPLQRAAYDGCLDGLRRARR